MTAGCPLGHRCESCGTAEGVLVIVERELLLNDSPTGRTFCLTQCPRCARYVGPVPIAAAALVRFVAQHAEHNGAEPRA